MDKDYEKMIRNKKADIYSLIQKFLFLLEKDLYQKKKHQMEK